MRPNQAIANESEMPLEVAVGVFPTHEDAGRVAASLWGLGSERLLELTRPVAVLSSPITKTIGECSLTVCLSLSSQGMKRLATNMATSSWNSVPKTSTNILRSISSFENLRKAGFLALKLNRRLFNSLLNHRRTFRVIRNYQQRLIHTFVQGDGLGDDTQFAVIA